MPNAIFLLIYVDLVQLLGRRAEAGGNSVDERITTSFFWLHRTEPNDSVEQKRKVHLVPADGFP